MATLSARAKLMPLFAFAILAFHAAIALAWQQNDKTGIPFRNYHKVAENIFVVDRGHFVRYTGPQRDLRRETPEYEGVERNRIGTIIIAPGVKAYIETVLHPIGSEYELRDVKDGRLIHRFYYDHRPFAPLLFNGQGVIYEYAALGDLCWGSVTRKYIFKEGEISEVTQPLVFLNAKTRLLKDVRLYSTPDKNSTEVASLPAGTMVTVLTAQDARLFLLSSPLGLTGWHIDGGPEGSSLEITQCN